MTTPAPLTDEEIAQLERLAEKATPGKRAVFVPKKTGGAFGDSGDRGIEVEGVMIGEMWEHCPWRGNPDGLRVDANANAAFIAACDPQTILRLTAQVRHLTTQLAEARAKERTPGTVEVCRYCRFADQELVTPKYGNTSTVFEWGQCKERGCPLRPTSTHSEGEGK